jgi:hypothetical protein
MASEFSWSAAGVVGGTTAGGGETDGIGVTGGTVWWKSATSAGVVDGVSRRSSAAPSSRM